jgi:hypothetical protein
MDDATLTDKLVDSLRMGSAAAITLMIGIATVSVYLLQRSIRYFANPPDIPSMYLSSGGEGFQINFWGLQFGYETLTLIWPAVLGGLCFACSALLRKRLLILEHLQRLNPELQPDHLEALDPFLLGSASASITSHRVFRLAAVLPMIALIPHFVSASVALISIVAPGGAYSRLLSWTMPLILFVVAVLIAASAFGFVGAREFARAMRATLIVRDSRKAPDTSLSDA